MNIENVDSFVSKTISSDIFDVRSAITDRVSQSSAGSSIFNAMDKYYHTLDSEQVDIPAEKAGIIANDGLLAELAKSSVNEEGDIAGRTIDFEDLYKKVTNWRKLVDFRDNEKLAEKGYMPSTKMKSDKRFDSEEVGMYGECTECGKPLSKPSKNGYCSKKCAIAHNKKFITSKISEFRVEKEKLSSKVNAAVKLGNNLLSALSDMSSELSSLHSQGFDERYYVYFKIALTSLIEYIKRNVNDLLIQKNNYVMGKLEKKKAHIKEKLDLGSDEAVKNAEKVFEKLEKAEKAAQALNDKMNEVYKKAYDIICEVEPTRIEQDSLSFGMTVRSNTYYPMKFAKKLENNNMDDSVCDVIDSEAILKAVDNKFPWMTENDFTKEPGAFNAKKLLSHYNVQAQKDMIEIMCDTWKKGAEPLPKYEKLSIPGMTWPPIVNIHWMVFLFTSWGPHGQKHYAIPFAS